MGLSPEIRKFDRLSVFTDDDDDIPRDPELGKKVSSTLLSLKNIVYDEAKSKNLIPKKKNMVKYSHNNLTQFTPVSLLGEDQESEEKKPKKRSLIPLDRGVSEDIIEKFQAKDHILEESSVSSNSSISMDRS